MKLRCKACNRTMFNTEDPEDLCGVCVDQIELCDLVPEKTISYAFENVTNDVHFDFDGGLTVNRID